MPSPAQPTAISVVRVADLLPSCRCALTAAFEVGIRRAAAVTGAKNGTVHVRGGDLVALIRRFESLPTAFRFPGTQLVLAQGARRYEFDNIAPDADFAFTASVAIAAPNVARLARAHVAGTTGVRRRV